jgi:hypothetical protein
MGIAAPVIGADDIVDGDTGADGQETLVTNDDQANF